MIKVLLKKQILEMFRSFFYDRKNGKSRTKISSAILIILYGGLLVFLIGGMFLTLSNSLCNPLIKLNLNWLYFAIIGLLALAFGVFGSVFNTFQGLYLAKDNDLLLSMPIPTKYIIISRLLGSYLIGLMFSGLIIVPACIVYNLYIPFNIVTIICNIVFIILISLAVLIVTCALGYVIAKISVKLKNKSLITVFAAIAFLVIYYYISYKAQSVFTYFLTNALNIGNKIKGSAVLVYYLGSAGAGNILHLFLFAIVVFVLLAVTFIIIEKSFLKIATGSIKTSQAKNNAKNKIKQKSLNMALLSKEFKRFLSSPSYMLNCGLGIIFALAAAVAIILKGDLLNQIVISIFNNNNIMSGIIIGVLCMAASFNDITAPSISLEGKTVYILQMLPINMFLAIKAKINMHVILNGIPILLCSIVSIIVFKPSLFYMAAIIIAPQLYGVFSALFGIMVNLKRPNLNWTNEIVPIKQSLSVVLVILTNFAIGILYFVGFFTLINVINTAYYIAIFAAVILIINIIIYNWLKTKGAKIFANL